MLMNGEGSQKYSIVPLEEVKKNIIKSRKNQRRKPRTSHILLERETDIELIDAILNNFQPENSYESRKRMREDMSYLCSTRKQDYLRSGNGRALLIYRTVNRAIPLFFNNIELDNWLDSIKKSEEFSNANNKWINKHKKNYGCYPTGYEPKPMSELEIERKRELDMISHQDKEIIEMLCEGKFDDTYVPYSISLYPQVSSLADATKARYMSIGEGSDLSCYENLRKLSICLQQPKRAFNRWWFSVKE